jgi:hypothetical protein
MISGTTAMKGRNLTRNKQLKYEGCSESKERLLIQPAQLFHCTTSVIWLNLVAFHFQAGGPPLSAVRDWLDILADNPPPPFSTPGRAMPWWHCSYEKPDSLLEDGTDEWKRISRWEVRPIFTFPWSRQWLRNDVYEQPRLYSCKVR